MAAIATGAAERPAWLRKSEIGALRAIEASRTSLRAVMTAPDVVYQVGLTVTVALKKLAVLDYDKAVACSNVTVIGSHVATDHPIVAGLTVTAWASLASELKATIWAVKGSEEDRWMACIVCLCAELDSETAIEHIKTALASRMSDMVDYPTSIMARLKVSVVRLEW